jgi:hypothetical protein
MGALITIHVEDEKSNRPNGKLSEVPSRAWKKAFDGVIQWTKKNGDKPDGLGDPDIPQIVIDSTFEIVKDELQMRITPFKTWADVREFIEDVAIAYANKTAAR